MLARCRVGGMIHLASDLPLELGPALKPSQWAGAGDGAGWGGGGLVDQALLRNCAV